MSHLSRLYQTDYSEWARRNAVGLNRFCRLRAGLVGRPLLKGAQVLGRRLCVLRCVLFLE